MNRYGQSKALFTGDAGFEVERELVRLFDLDADILKIGHHGSKYSSSAEFLDKATPQWAVIQVGENNYGHPAESVLQLLAERGIKVLRNDEQGTVTFFSNGSLFYLSSDGLIP